MHFPFRAGLGFLPLLMAASIGGDDFLIRIQARSGRLEQTAAGQANRPILTVKAGASIHVQWSAVNGDKPGTIHDVTMHCFLAREQTVGQRELPKLGPDAFYESALTMDFEPKAHSGANFVLQTPAPGIYMLRVETIGAAKEHGHEHYAAMDVKVE